MTVKIQKNKKDLAQSQSKTSKTVKDIDQDTHDHLETSPQTDTQSPSVQQPGNVDL